MHITVEVTEIEWDREFEGMPTSPITVTVLKHDNDDVLRASIANEIYDIFAESFSSFTWQVIPEPSDLYAEVVRIRKEGHKYRTNKLNEYISLIRKNILDAAFDGLDCVELLYTFEHYSFDVFADAFKNMYPEFNIVTTDNSNYFQITWEYN